MFDVTPKTSTFNLHSYVHDHTLNPLIQQPQPTKICFRLYSCNCACMHVPIIPREHSLKYLTFWHYYRISLKGLLSITALFLYMYIATACWNNFCLALMSKCLHLLICIFWILLYIIHKLFIIANFEVFIFRKCLIY